MERGGHDFQTTFRRIFKKIQSLRMDGRGLFSKKIQTEFRNMVQHEKIQTNSETMGLAVHRRFQWIVHVQLHH